MKFVQSALAAMVAIATIATSAPAFAQMLSVDQLNAPDPQTIYYSRKGEARFCDDAGVLGRIADKFHYQVTHVPNLPDVRIVDFKRIHQNRNSVASEDWPIGRRYCGAKVTLSDGRDRDVWYLIEAGMGLAGIAGDNVEFCVSGFDRWYVYNGRCRVLR